MVVAHRNIYKLHAILCHSGTLNAGHYFCFIKVGKPSSDGKVNFEDGTWVKFNDMNVTKALKHVAIGTG